MKVFRISIGKSGKQNTVGNHDQVQKEESVKDTDSRVSGINTISEKKNTTKRKNQRKRTIYRHTKCIYMYLIFILVEAGLVQ